MSARLSLSILLATFLAVPAAAQLARPGQPASLRSAHLLASEVPTYLLPHPDVERLLREDAERNQWPPRYGAVIPVSYATDDAGSWESLPAGRLVWRMRLMSPGAHSLGVVFDRYELPPSGELYLYSHGHETILGAYTSAARQPNGMLAVQPVLGDELTLEYVQDAADPGRPSLRLGEVVHDYRGILDALAVDAPLALSAGCLVDVNCPQGAEYQDIKRSALFMLFSGSYCSAALLSNTAEDATPYFLTANHCGDMTNSVAVFGYENSGCATGDANQLNTLSGATLLASSTRFDSQLYLLSGSPPPSFVPFFAGWDRGTSQPGPGVGISYPSGKAKKLTRDNDAPVLNGDDFRATWELGKLEGGSSGSPLFSGAKRVLGPACCVSDFNCRTQWAIYGRLGGFWLQKNLEQWLDPLGNDPQGIDGFDPQQGSAVSYDGGGTNPVLYTSTPPTVGSTWTATVDTSTLPFPNASTWIAGYRRSSTGQFVPQGELLVDVTSHLLFTSVAPASGGVSVHSRPIPNDPALIGMTAYTQAVLVLGAPLTLTNGLELRFR